MNTPNGEDGSVGSYFSLENLDSALPSLRSGESVCYVVKQLVEGSLC